MKTLSAVLLVLGAASARAESPSVSLGVNLAGGLDADAEFALLRPGLFVELRFAAVRLDLGASYGLSTFQAASSAAHETRADVAVLWGTALGVASLDLGVGALGGATVATFQAPTTTELSALPSFGLKGLAALSLPVGEHALFRISLQPEGVWTWVTLPAWSWLPDVMFDLRLLLVASFAWRLT